MEEVKPVMHLGVSFSRFGVAKPPVNSWSVQRGTNAEGAIYESGQRLLLFHPRTFNASGTANVEMHNPPEHHKVGSGGFRVGTKWGPVTCPSSLRKTSHRACTMSPSILARGCSASTSVGCGCRTTDPITRRRGCRIPTSTSGAAKRPLPGVGKQERSFRMQPQRRRRSPRKVWRKLICGR